MNKRCDAHNYAMLQPDLLYHQAHATTNGTESSDSRELKSLAVEFEFSMIEVTTAWNLVYSLIELREILNLAHSLGACPVAIADFIVNKSSKFNFLK